MWAKINNLLLMLISFSCGLTHQFRLKGVKIVTNSLTLQLNLLMDNHVTRGGN